MRAVPPATRRQARVFAAFRQSRKRTQAEEQNQKDGEAATHLQSMLAGTDSIGAASGNNLRIASRRLGTKTNRTTTALDSVNLTPDDY
jgi:molecular chaperone GrpE (heat shock protein)